MKKKKKRKIKVLSPGEAVQYINSRLGYESFVRPPEYWLDTGSKRCNAVFGSRELGIPYGKMITIAGEPSSGKSAIAAWLEGLAQKDGAEPGWIDGENSFERRHVRKQELDPGHRILDKDGNVVGYTKLALFRPEYGVFKHVKKKGSVRAIVEEDIETAEELFERGETWMKLMRRQNPRGKRILVVDSTTSFVPQEEMEAGFSDQNMRTRMSPARFLNDVAKKWVSVALHTNTLVIFIAQLRDSPTMYGPSKRVTGGNGILFFPSAVVWMSRVKGGELIVGGRQVGVKGMIINRKNKMGGGSIERKKCGYHAHFFEPKWKFMSTKEVKGK